MRKSGCWGGHLELLAVAHAFNVDVVIHQVIHIAQKIMNLFEYL
jgi:hypothetical protein